MTDISFEASLNELEKIKVSSPMDYDKYYWRVRGAYLENLYMQMEFYGERYGKSYCEEAINLFEATCRKLNIVVMDEGESKTMYKYISRWRALYV